MTKRAISLSDGVPVLPVKPSYRSQDRTDLPARIADAAQDYREATGRNPRLAYLGTREILELMTILVSEAQYAFGVTDYGTVLPSNLTCCGLKIVARAQHATLLEIG